MTQRVERGRRTIALVAGFLIFTGLVLFFLLRLIAGMQESARIAGETARGIVAEIRDTVGMEPKIIINNRVVLQGRSEISELALEERTFSQTLRWEHRWLGSTKTVVVEGDFVAKSGFSFGDDFALVLDLTNNLAQVALPPARLLSCDLVEVRLLSDDSGYWNRLNTQDREEVMNRLLRSSRVLIEETGINQQAEDNLRRRLKEVLQRRGFEVPDHTS